MSEMTQSETTVIFPLGEKIENAGGQILLVTGGRGYYQEWGSDARELRAGDVVQIPAGVKHWHGASPRSSFVHIAIEVQPEKGPPVWMEPVSDDDYNMLG
jgi:quercetin dioxygenase-like cupin family protein